MTKNGFPFVFSGVVVGQSKNSNQANLTMLNVDGPLLSSGMGCQEDINQPISAKIVPGNKFDDSRFSTNGYLLYIHTTNPPSPRHSSL